jgi:hypothetical protein
MNNFPQINWCVNRNKENTKSSANTDPSLKGTEKRCKNSAEMSKAMAIRIADLFGLHIAEPDAEDVSAGTGRFTLYWFTLVMVPIV